MDPAARPTGMRERYSNHFRACTLDLMLPPNQCLEWQTREEALDREPTDGDEKPGSHEPELVVEPAGAGGTFHGRGHAIATPARARAGIATRDRRDVDPLACRRLVEADPFEPAEEGLAGAAGECAPASALDLPRCLTDQHHARSASE